MNHRATRLVVLDVDSTLSNEEGIDEIAALAGGEIRERVADITARAMAGELDFAESLRQRVLALRGLSVEIVERASARVTSTPGAEELVDAIHQAGGVVCAVSGGFHELVDPLAQRLGLDDWAANRLESDRGVLTGGLNGPLIDQHQKARWLRHWAERWGVSAENTVAIGDGANDLEMMRIAGVSIGFVPKDIVRLHATYSIDRRDLGLALPLMGLTRS